MMKVISHYFFPNPFIKLPLYFTLVELRKVPSMALKRMEIGLVILWGCPFSSLHNNIIQYFPSPPLDLFPWLPSELPMKKDFQILSAWDAYCFSRMSSSLFLAINEWGCVGCLILHILRKPNSLIALLFIQNNF